MPTEQMWAILTVLTDMWAAGASEPHESGVQCGERNCFHEPRLGEKSREHEDVAGPILTKHPKVKQGWGRDCLSQDSFCFNSASEVHMNLILQGTQHFTLSQNPQDKGPAASPTPQAPSWLQLPAAHHPLGVVLGVPV